MANHFYRPLILLEIENIGLGFAHKDILDI